MTYDYIIVGGGSAGSVLANRLSARSANQVLLCEAGQDTPHGKVPAEILDSYPGAAYLNPRYTWSGLKVSTQPISHNAPPGESPPKRVYEQARVLGGGSSINGQLANRGAPHDYDEWQSLGAQGWDWASVLPYFKKLERDMDFDDSWHGQSGPIPVRRVFPDLWSAHAQSIGKALTNAGYPYVVDQNGEFVDGHFPVTISNAYERRVSAAIGYLHPGVRQRPNLCISTDTQVTSLIFEGTRCVGVKALVAGREQTFKGGEVILASGAIHTPAHLLRAGVGPALALQELGIAVVANVPGVGQHLMDHPAVAVASFIKPHARMNAFTRRHIQVALRYSSGLDGVPPGDMFVACASKSSWHAVGEQIGSMIATVYKTYSHNGQVKLVSPDWRVEPDVAFNLLSDRRDLLRLMDGFKRMAMLYEDPDMQAACSDPFPASWGEKVRQVGQVTHKNKLITDLAARLLDGPQWLRRYMMQKYVTDAETINGLMQDEAALEAFVSKAAVGVWHASCTCRMGASNDPNAVTDPFGRVRGVQAVRVADASLFPVVPCANTNFPTLMTAEKVADAILNDQIG